MIIFEMMSVERLKFRKVSQKSARIYVASSWRLAMRELSAVRKRRRNILSMRY